MLFLHECNLQLATPGHHRRSIAARITRDTKEAALAWVAEFGRVGYVSGMAHSSPLKMTFRGKAQPLLKVNSGVFAKRSSDCTFPFRPATARMVLYSFKPQKTAVLFTPYGCTVTALKLKTSVRLATFGC